MMAIETEPAPRQGCWLTGTESGSVSETESLSELVSDYFMAPFSLKYFTAPGW